MVDALAGPGTAVDIRLSALEPVQQLRLHLASQLGNELSRLRADAAFASMTGTAVQAPAQHNDSLRAQQRSVLAQVAVGLTLHPAAHMHSTTAAEHFAKADEQIHESAERQQHENPAHADQPETEAAADEQTDSSLVEALRNALTQFKSTATAAGYTGSPIVIAAPARCWLEAHAPADVRYQIDDATDLLVLCLAFDGVLGQLHTVLGLVFHNDRCVAHLEAGWSENGRQHSAEQVCTQLIEPCSMVSDVLMNVNAEVGQVAGIRVKLDDSTAEPALWYWHAKQWFWL